jgi:hypothetical protein
MSSDRRDIVEVEWVDSTGHSEWHQPEEAQELLTKLDCRSAGYLIADEPDGIIVALGIGAFGQYLDSMAIPRTAIRSLTRLHHSKKAKQ